MKKLLIASMVAALTAGAWAADAATYTKTQQGFEYDAAGTSTFDISDGFWSADEGVSSTVEVKTYEDGAAYTYATSGGNVAAFGGPGSYYLNLETDSGKMLRRNFAENTGAVTVNADNSYVVDTLVKFTATEDAPTVDTANGDKFILWLQSTEGDSGTTYSLMATCGVIDEMGGIKTDVDDNAVSTNVALNATVSADQWARVTVKAIATGSGDSVLGFVVYVDGVAVDVDEEAYSALYEDVSTDYNAEAKAFRSERKLLPCLMTGSAVNSEETEIGSALTSVGFEGTGAIDDLMIVASSDSEAPSFTAWSAPTSYTVSFQAVGLAEGTTWSMTELSVTSGGTVAEQEAPTVSGYTLVGWYSNSECTTEFVFGEGGTTIMQATTIYVKYEVTATPVAPGETVTGSTAEAATTALNNAGIKDPFDGITDEQKNAYAALFEATATLAEDGTYTATWTLTQEAEETLTGEANDALALTLNGVLDGDSTVSITATPGIYYTVLQSETLTATEYTVVGWAQATGDTLSLTLPTKGDATQCFYKIGVTAVKPTTAAE